MASFPAAQNPEAANFAPGSVVEVRDEEWLVTGMERASDGWFVDVTGLTGIVRDQAATFSTALDQVTPRDPKHTKVVADTSPRFRTARLWLESMIRRTAIPISEPNLTVATSALADPLPYQQRAATLALSPQKLRPRILLADAVGLGKTIEIGMILSELVRRGRGERILIVTPKHVLEQMQFEMWTRFALPFIRLDSTGIQRIRQELPAGRNPFTYYKRVIVSIDTLKSDQYIPHLRAQRWDAVVIDESHNVTNTATMNHRLADLLARNTDALVLASATPHNGKRESFAELVRMLEPSAVSPSGEVNEDMLSELVVRRHRHSPEVARVVGSDWAERQEPDNRYVDASPIENEIARELEDTWLWPQGSAPTNSPLVPWLLAKAFLSSPAALDATVQERIKRVDDGAASVSQDARQFERERQALTRLADLAQQSLHQPSAKYEALLQYLREIDVGPGKPGRAVVFSERVPTLHWLREGLIRDMKFKPEQVAVLHGGMSDVEQQAVVESFKLVSSPIRVLVTGDLASEGVNLHAQCHHLLHYDIPWSLIRIEQRNGRIDRYGQRHNPRITTLLLRPDSDRFAGDFRVLTRLMEREHEAHRALGDAASLIGTYNVKAEEDKLIDVIRGAKELDEVVRTPEEVTEDSGPTGMLARIFNLGGTPAQPSPAAPPAPAAEPRIDQATEQPAQATTAGATTGLFDSEVDLLATGLQAIMPTPTAKPNNGVAWTQHENHQIASLIPPDELKQRLQVLPQSYLHERRVREKLQLATSKPRGEIELTNARSAESTSAWPEAHYLSPLHPVLDWVADRVLATLERGTIFAVRGGVDLPTVLLQSTLTNARGQVIASGYHTAAFFNPDASPILTPHATAAEALTALHLATSNRGEVDHATLERLTALIPPAVTAIEDFLPNQEQTIRDSTAQRVRDWQDRTQAWADQAQELIQRKTLKLRQDVISQEQELAADMLPERSLVRPLLVITPEEAN